MTKNKLAALALTVVIAVGIIPTSAFAASSTSQSRAEQHAVLSDNYDAGGWADSVKSLSGITDEEKRLLIDTYNAIDKLYEQMATVYGDKEELSASEEKMVNDLYKQIDTLYEKIADIETKAYVAGLTGITDEEKNQLLEAYKTMDYDKIDDIETKVYVASLTGITDKEKNQLLEAYRSMDYGKIADIETKAYVAGFTGITDEEKARLLEAYRAMDKVYDEIEAIYADKAELTEAEEKKVQGLYGELEALEKKINDITVKVEYKD